MNAYQHKHAHSYEHPHSVFDFKSASLFQSLTTAATIGIFVGSVGVALNAVWFYRQTSWHVTAMAQGLVQTLIAFLNHHVRNALTQMGMYYVADPEKREHLLQDAVARVCGGVVPNRKQRGSDRAVSRSWLLDPVLPVDLPSPRVPSMTMGELRASSSTLPRHDSRAASLGPPRKTQSLKVQEVHLEYSRRLSP
jgi:hypothetical protein